MSDLSSAYNPKEVEQKIYELWEKSGFFNPDNLPIKKSKPYSITLAPPNVTGSLHMGHALEHATSDTLIRFKRMQGFQTLWLPGTDHAGIATQNVVEKDLKKQGVSRHDLGREKFLEKIWEWKKKYGDIIFSQMKKLGASCDWSRSRFTMDDDYQETVKKAFLHYHKKGWIYEGERVISWCVRCQTSLSDLELEYTEEKGKLWFIRYPLKSQKSDEYIIVATTRPETMLGDTAVAVNPKDKRYKNLIGQKVILPIQNREIPIVADKRVEMSFGTGAVKVTPAHDALDEQIGLDHHLSAPRVIDEFGKITEEAGEKFAGMKILEAREAIIKELETQNLLEKTENYTHNVAKCYRCDSTIEPLKSKQWFLKMDELAKMAIKTVKSGQIKFHPRRWEKIYFSWLANIKDWCISRQIWWGHKIPIEGVNDVLDTWFSSALWPFATLGANDLKKFYPIDALTNDRGIINLWDARMIFSGLEFTKKIPFKDLLIHATILTKDGKRMSKSLGTGIDPMILIEQHGADAVRFGLIWQAMGGQDIRWSEEHVIAGKKFCNKIWNASRFVLQNANSKFKNQNACLASRRAKLQCKIKNLTTADREILKQLNQAIKITTKHLDNFEFGQALHNLYNFFWHEFCDKYIEEFKQAETKNSNVLPYVLATSLKLLHPFMPFITEEIWSKLPIKDKKLLIVEKWPK